MFNDRPLLIFLFFPENVAEKFDLGLEHHIRALRKWLEIL